MTPQKIPYALSTLDDDVRQMRERVSFPDTLSVHLADLEAQGLKLRPIIERLDAALRLADEQVAALVAAAEAALDNLPLLLTVADATKAAIHARGALQRAWEKANEDDAAAFAVPDSHFHAKWMKDDFGVEPREDEDDNEIDLRVARLAQGGASDGRIAKLLIDMAASVHEGEGLAEDVLRLVADTRARILLDLGCPDDDHEEQRARDAELFKRIKANVRKRRQRLKSLGARLGGGTK